MQRTIIKDLEKWKNSPGRKPLILSGARQVGKTWILKEFGRQFDDGYAYFNFQRQVEYHDFFRTTKEPDRLITNLSFAFGKKITQNTLIIFDEIQECPEALNSLKYFREDRPEYCVAAAGSLLGLSLAGGFPVGQVNMLTMQPMTFTEFLLASEEAGLVSYMESVTQPETVPLAFFSILTEKLKEYFITGGMPEAVQKWQNLHSPDETDLILADILGTYQNDFGNHAPPSEVPKIRLIWDSISSQITKENRKFMYSTVKNGARAREYENALNWLCNAQLLRKVMRITKPALPLSAYEDQSSFKVYMLDTGLLRRHSFLAYTAFTEENRLFTEFRGALTENYILQSLSTQFEVRPHYWTEQPYEVDFIIQYRNSVIPVEVKAGESIRSKSLKYYAEKYGTLVPLIIRYSLKNLSLDGNILNIPLFMADRTAAILQNILK